MKNDFNYRVGRAYFKTKEEAEKYKKKIKSKYPIMETKKQINEKNT